MYIYIYVHICIDIYISLQQCEAPQPPNTSLLTGARGQHGIVDGGQPLLRSLEAVGRNGAVLAASRNIGSCPLKAMASGIPLVLSLRTRL